ncbi:M15 family metallopeptidase [Muricoccus aerilatus]|uniref:M15 family metallopeptidase n=1 Tax=Muricoccus aerilatus TaxID=452982 RepID=UPI000A04DF41|nr:M15 family metallopeptidase [Roseomonas aerilata]
MRGFLRWLTGKDGSSVATWEEGEPDITVDVHPAAPPKPPAAKPEPAKPSPALIVQKDELLLVGVHPGLVRVVLRARWDGAAFRIIEGLRSKERQAMMVSSGKSQTMKSRHLTGHAVDLAPVVGGSVTWDWTHYYPLAERVKAAAKAEGVPIEWGGDWISFKDGPHWQLPMRAPYLA